MNQYYQKLPDRSLTTKDINGAQSRQLHYALNRNLPPYHEERPMFAFPNPI